MVRDYQRQKVYNAERQHSMFHYNAEASKLPTAKWDVLNQYVANLTTTEWFKSRWPHQSIRVKDGRRCRRATGGWGRISMPKWSRCPLVILHEIAHAVGNWTGDKHGPNYCGHYLYLVYHQLGEKAYLELRTSFLRHGVDFKDPFMKALAPITKEEVLAKIQAKPKRKANPAAIEALRRYREQKKMAASQPLDNREVV